MKKTFQDLPTVGTNEVLDDYQQVVTKAGTDKRVPFSRMKSNILAALEVESGLHTDTATKKARLGGTLKENTVIDGDGFGLNMQNLNGLAISTDAAGSAKSGLTLSKLLSQPVRLKNEKSSDPGVFSEVVLDADNYSRLAQQNGNSLAVIEAVNGTDVTMRNNARTIAIKANGHFMTGVDAQTAETDILYIDANGKISKGVAPSGGGVNSFDVAYMKQIPFINLANITQATLETAFRATVSNAILNGYYIAVFRCSQSTPLSKSATVNYQIAGQSAATFTAKHGVFVSFKYINNVLADIEALTDSAIVDAITALESVNSSTETANTLTNSDTVIFDDYINDPLNRKIQGHVQIPALVSPTSIQGVSLNALEVGSDGKLVVGKVETESSETILLDFRKESSTKKTFIKGQVQTAALVSSNSGNQIELRDLTLLDGRVIQQMYVAPSSGGGGSVALSNDVDNMATLNGNSELYVQTIEKQFLIACPIASSSLTVWGCADNILPILNNDFSANFDSGSKILIFQNDSAINGKSKSPRFKTIEITLSNMTGILDANGDFKVKIPRSFLLAKNGLADASSNEFRASFPRPRIQDVSASSVSESTPFLWASDANAPVQTWMDSTFVYYKFIGLNLFDRVQLYLTF